MDEILPMGLRLHFFEYAITSSWMDTSYQYLNRLWFDGDKVVAFIFTESPVTNLFINLRPGYEEEDLIFDFQNELNYPLPEGFHFIDANAVDPVKLARCCWKGFDHEQDIGTFEKWEEADNGSSWNPQKGFNGVRQSMQIENRTVFRGRS